jgi:acyl-ACP thioesterase
VGSLAANNNDYFSIISSFTCSHMLTHVIVLRTKYIARKRVLVGNTAVIQ